ncbi:MAG: RimK-like ATPgrasp N-terminal domain-containing protein [Archaeoglobales archaeon]|nr:RimK-like ATPgrasp N-terminal domain-containing protein [Archaeoglobales archaeon]
MIIVAEGDEDKSLEPPDSFLKKRVSDTVLNLLGDYRFHTKGYYVSLHAEENNCIVYPGVKNALDIYRAPIFIERLKKAGLDVPEFEVIPRPIPEKTIMLPLNPFSKNSMKVVKNDSQYYKYFKSLSMDYHYPVVHVKVEGKVDEVYMHLNRAKNGGEEEKVIARKVFEIFGVPLGKIFIERIDGKIRPFYFMPLNRKEIDIELVVQAIYEDRLLR